MMKLYLQLNEPGSGEISVPLDSAAAADVTDGMFVQLIYRGEVRGGFFVDIPKKTVVDGEERQSRWLQISGCGMLALLDRAIVWDWMTPGLANVRKFTSLPKGAMLYRLLDEAKNYQENEIGQKLERYCFPMLNWDFTETHDSAGNAWTDSEDIEIPVGTHLLDVLRQFAELGIDFDIQPLSNGEFLLSAYRDGLGEDVSDTIHMRVGYNCMMISEEEQGTEIRNAILVEFSHSSVPYTSVEDADSIDAYGRRESLLQAANASSEASAQQFGNAELARLKDPKRSIAVKVADAVGLRVFVDYNLGYWVNYDDGTGTEIKYRIRGMQLEWEEGKWYADVVLLLNSISMENEIRMARDLRKTGGASSGAAVMNPTNPASIGGALVGEHDADPDAHGGSPATTAENDFIVGDDTPGKWIKKTLAETQAILGVGGGGGDVVGPAGAVDGNLAAFDTATGKLLKDSGYAPEDFITVASTNWIDLTDGGVTTLHSHAGGGGDISGTGIVGQVAEFVTDTKTLQAAKIIGPATNILTLTNAAAATFGLAIAAGKTLILTSTNDFNATIPATGTVAMLGVANVFTTQQMVDGTSDQIQLRVQGHNTQTTNLQAWENSAGAVLVNITGVGVILQNPDALSPSFTSNYKAAFLTKDTSTSGTRTGLITEVTIQPASTSAANFSINAVRAITAGSSNILTARGARYEVFHSGMGTLTVGVTFLALVTANFGGGITTATGGYFQINTNGSAPTIPLITTARAIFVASPANSEGGAVNITTNYGIYIASQAANGENFALYSNAGLVRLGDQLVIIGSANRQQFIITGFSTQTIATPMAQITRNDTAAGISAMLGLTALGSGANGDGGYVPLAGKSSTTEATLMGRLDWQWVSATHASRTSRITISAYDTVVRECIRLEASGSAAMVGFFGHAAAVQPTKSAHNNWASISDVTAALAELGFVDAP